MNYKKIYDQLVEKCRVRGLDRNSVDYYTEVHHIVPKCLGGTDDKENLVMFNGREHFVAHMLLWKAYPDNISLMRAAFMMSSRWESGGLEEGKPIHSKTYATLREEYSEAVREQCKGEGNPFFGRTHTNETMDRIKASRRETERKKRLINWKMNNEKYMSRFRLKPLSVEKFDQSIPCQVRPLHAKYELDIWMLSEQIKSYWEMAGRPDKKFLCNQIYSVSGFRFPQHRLKVMMEKFINGWEPSSDSSYILTALNFYTKDNNQRIEIFEASTCKTVSELNAEYFINWLTSRDAHRKIIEDYIIANGVEKHKNNSKSKLSLVDVVEACILWKSGKVEQKQLAELLGVARNSISNAMEAEGRWLSARHAANALANTHFKELLNE